MFCSHFWYSKNQRLVRFPYRVQCLKVTDDTAAGRECRECSQNENGENGGHFGTEAEKLPRVKGAGDVKREALTSEGKPEFCLVPAQMTPQLETREGPDKVKTIIRLVPDSQF